MALLRGQAYTPKNQFDEKFEEPFSRNTTKLCRTLLFSCHTMERNLSLFFFLSRAIYIFGICMDNEGPDYSAQPNKPDISLAICLYNRGRCDVHLYNRYKYWTAKLDQTARMRKIVWSFAIILSALWIFWFCFR